MNYTGDKLKKIPSDEDNQREVYNDYERENITLQGKDFHPVPHKYCIILYVMTWYNTIFITRKALTIFFLQNLTGPCSGLSNEALCILI